MCRRTEEEVVPTVGLPRHRHFVGFFNVPVLAPTQDHPFYTVIPTHRPIYSPFTITLGIRTTHSRLNPRALTGEMQFNTNSTWFSELKQTCYNYFESPLSSRCCFTKVLNTSFSFTFHDVTRTLLPILNTIIKEGTRLTCFIRVTIKSRLVHNPSSGRQITLLAAAR